MTFRPMLAGKADIEKLQYPIMVSAKLDGVRALAVDGVLMSRSMKPIPNAHCQQLFKDFGALDGELIVGDPTHPHCYNKTVSAVMTRDGVPDVWYYVFDQVDSGVIFSARYHHALKWYAGAPNMVMVPHDLVMNYNQLLDYEVKTLAAGFEGVMIRDPSGPYKQGRSTTNEGWLLKLKRFADSEAVILDMKEKLHNANEQTTNELGLHTRSSHKANMVPQGTLGALVVRDVHSGVEFDIGTGFDEGNRAYFWDNRHLLLGKIVKYKHQPMGALDKPRFPVYLGFRPEGA